MELKRVFDYAELYIISERNLLLSKLCTESDIEVLKEIEYQILLFERELEEIKHRKRYA